ncbi:hypothetical protein GGF40_003115 [Coemansia sp. RSA 1286]|nr:hypothetical protein GGF40_003115 [Coemansia sp. RSA 1286]
MRRDLQFGPNGVAPDEKNDISDVRYLSYAQLLYKGQDTSCVVIPLTNTQGIVAANCLEATTGSSTASDYTVAVMGSNYGLVKEVGVSLITNHPSYTKGSFANNLAILTYGDPYEGASGYKGIIADYPQGFGDVYYVKYTMESGNPFKAGEPEMRPYLATESGPCNSSSPLFQANFENFACNYANIPSSNSDGCVTGYSAVIGRDGNSIAFAGLYSYSIGDATNGLCGSTDPVLSYYTLLRNYIPWITSVIGGDDKISVMYTEKAGRTASTAPSNFAFVDASAAGGGLVARNGLAEQPAKEVVAPISRAAASPVSVAAATSEIVQTVLSTQVTTLTQTITEETTTTDSTLLSTETTTTISTTTTSTTVETSTSVTTSTSVVASTSTVTVTSINAQNANGDNNGGGNSIAINISNGGNPANGQVVTVTATTTETVSEIQTMTETSVMTVTASVILSQSIVPGENNPIVVTQPVDVDPATETVTFTSVTTSVVRSIYTVTAVPTGSVGGEAVPTTILTTVTVTESPTDNSSSDADVSSKPISAGASEDDQSVAVDDTEKKSLSPGIIAAIAIICAILLGLLLWFLWRRKNKNKEDPLSRVRRWMFERNVQNLDEFNRDSYYNDPRRYTGDSRRFAANPHRFTGDSRRFTADSRRFTGDSRRYTGNSMRQVGDTRSYMSNGRQYAQDKPPDYMS